MKKFYFLLSFIVVCISCSSDSNGDVVDTNLLQRVDFYPGTVSEKRWIFNENGLLKEITKADGTVVQTFTYNSANLLTSSIVFNAGFTENHTFTYDNNGFVTAVDSQIVNYDSTLDAYYTGDLSVVYRLTKLNGDKLLLDARTVVLETDEAVPYESHYYQMAISYDSNNNLASYFPLYEQCNYLTFDNKVNPLRNATFSICRAFAFIPDSIWVINDCISANNALTHKYCLEDPESEVYHYTYNANDLPVVQIHDYYYLGAYESTVTSAKYYYQGDVLP